jgi:serine phosphatase RsbU (regulator of sigma subunit)
MALTALLMVSRVLEDEVFFGVVSHPVAHALSRLIQFVFFALLVWIVVDAIRRHRFDGWLVLPIVILRGMGSFYLDLVKLHLDLSWFVFGVPLDLRRVADPLIAIVIALLLLRRLSQSVKRQKQIAMDLKQAQEVQEVILPEHHIVLPGLEIESEYRPAREVGGDFFQIIPDAADGSLLIVAGDVAGKGLKAGMLVALLVGAIRTAAETDSDPGAILAALNRRLLGRGDARATCLALRIERDGSVTLANAGHLPPYLNGAPVEIEGSLPLGLIETFDCSVLQFHMSPSDRLLLVSDGVPEATDEQGILFGFDRVLDLVGTEPSAAKIAEAAQAFGQEDDISVISVTRVPVAEPALG